MYDSANIYDRLIKITENENISLAAFERKLGVGRNSISSVIRNKSSISHTVLASISSKYPQYSIDWIVFGKESPHTRAVTLLIKIKKLFKAWDIEDLESL
jgi:transcriptional regulator with XRE-family HTH domain